MPKGPFSQGEFVPTEWSTATEKAAFGNTLLHFLEAGCPRELFTKTFYTRLSMTFGNIAHYNLEGFYDTWFTRDRHRLGFVQKLLRWPCHGDPKFTFSDVEYAIQRLMRERNYLARFELGAAEELRAAEMKDLERLEAKYRKPQQVLPAAEEPAEVPAHISDEEMKSVVKSAVDSLYRLLWLREHDPQSYDEHLALGRRYTSHWDDPELKKPVRKGSGPK